MKCFAPDSSEWDDLSATTNLSQLSACDKSREFEKVENLCNAVGTSSSDSRPAAAVEESSRRSQSCLKSRSHETPEMYPTNLKTNYYCCYCCYCCCCCCSPTVVRQNRMVTWQFELAPARSGRIKILRRYYSILNCICISFDSGLFIFPNFEGFRKFGAWKESSIFPWIIIFILLLLYR